MDWDIDNRSTTLLDHPGVEQKKLVNFGPLIKKLRTLTHLKSPLRVLCMLTSEFDREYLWNGYRYGQAVNGVSNYDSFCIE